MQHISYVPPAIPLAAKFLQEPMHVQCPATQHPSSPSFPSITRKKSNIPDGRITVLRRCKMGFGCKRRLRWNGKRSLVSRLLKNTTMGRLFKNAPMRGTQKSKSEAYTRNTSSDEICSATPQRCVFQQPVRGRPLSKAIGNPDPAVSAAPSGCALST